MNSRLIWSLLAVGSLVTQGCGDPNAGTSEAAIRGSSGAGGTGAACESDLDCPQGEECELEHGGSFCKPHGGDDNGAGGAGVMDCESDLDCLQGEECEFEHGGSFCKPHGDDDCGNHDDIDDCGNDDDDSDDDNGAGGAGVMGCESDLDCLQGEECEFEHGGSFCKPHGDDDCGNDDCGADGGVMNCGSDLDCPQGEECEFEHGGSFCKPHGGQG